MRARIAVAAVGGLLAVALATGAPGCGGSELPLAKVHGKVTYKGKPLEQGQVVFIPGTGVLGPSAIGEIASDGTFRMTTADQDGAVIGTHKVMVHSRRPLTDAEKGTLKITELLVPAKYADEQNTPLTCEVKSGDNVLNLELVD